MRPLVLRMAAVAIAALAVPNAADAGSFLPAYSGYSRVTTPNSQADVSISFAVYKTSDNNFTNDFGTTAQNAFRALGSGFNAAASFVYFFQIVNDNPAGGLGADAAINSFLLKNFSVSSGAGYLMDLVFNDPSPGAFGGPVNNGNNNTALGSGGSFDTTPGNGIPSQSGVVTPGQQGGSGSLIGRSILQAFVPLTPESRGNPVEPLSASNTSAGITFSFNPPLQPGTSARPFGTSSVFFVTSNVAPKYGVGTVNAGSPPPGSFTASGDVPVATPEPGTLALLGLSLPLLGWGYTRRLRASKAIAAVAQ